MYRGTTAAYENPVSDDVQTRVRVDVVTFVSAPFGLVGSGLSERLRLQSVVLALVDRARIEQRLRVRDLLGG